MRTLTIILKRITDLAGQQIYLCLLTFVLLSCGHDEPEPTPTPVAKRTTVIVYMAAENSLSSFYNEDIREMVNACGDIPLDCNFVVYLDANSLPVIYTINAQQGKVQYLQLSEQDSANPDIFETTIRQIVQEFPATEHYRLVMWSHGSGWIPSPQNMTRSIGVDNNMNNSRLDKGSELEIPDMRKALERIGVHWDYILYDACFMQCVESDYELRQLADYIIASPAEIPGPGAPYHKIMKYMVDPNNEQAVQGIVEGYYQNYQNSDYGTLISAVRTSELEPLLTMTQQLLPNFYNEATTYPTQSLQAYCAYNFHTIWKPEFYDMGNLMHERLNVFDYANWQAQMEKTVCIRRFTTEWYSDYQSYDLHPIINDPDHIALLSIFVPNEKYELNTTLNDNIKDTEWYKDYVTK